VGGELRDIAVVRVADDVAGKMVPVQPTREGEGATLRAAELHDLSEEDGA
jgi:hypothetical protein